MKQNSMPRSVARDKYAKIIDETTPVLIADAGPTGLVLALRLTKSGVAVRNVDKAAEAGTTSRARRAGADARLVSPAVPLLIAQGHDVTAIGRSARAARPVAGDRRARHRARHVRRR